MASSWFSEGKRALMNKELVLDTDTLKVRAVFDTNYTFSDATTTMTPIVGYTGSTDATLASVDITTTPGTLGAADLSPAFSSLAQNSTDTIDALVVYHFNTNDAGSTPLVYIDLTSSVTPNGENINITWNASGIASL